MVKIREAIVVEGRYDKNTLSQVVDAPILETAGFGIFKDRQQMALLRRVAEKRGLIVFTDSDGAGFVIRNHIKSAIPGKYLKHAYIPDIPGKERRKSAPGREGKLGVEGMTPEVILAALRNAGATIEGEETTSYRGHHEAGSHGAEAFRRKQRRREAESASEKAEPAGTHERQRHVTGAEFVIHAGRAGANAG